MSCIYQQVSVDSPILMFPVSCIYQQVSNVDSAILMFPMSCICRQVSVDSPILMRMLASRRDIAQSVATAGVAGIVNVVATWNPCRLLIWSRNSGRTGVEAVEKLVSNL